MFGMKIQTRVRHFWWFSNFWIKMTALAIICKNALKRLYLAFKKKSIDLFISYRFYFFSIQNLMIDDILKMFQMEIANYPCSQKSILPLNPRKKVRRRHEPYGEPLLKLPPKIPTLIPLIMMLMVNKQTNPISSKMPLQLIN